MTLIRLGQLQEDSQDFVTAIRKIRKFQKSDYKKLCAGILLAGLLKKRRRFGRDGLIGVVHCLKQYLIHHFLILSFRSIPSCFSSSSIMKSILAKRLSSPENSCVV